MNEGWGILALLGHAAGGALELALGFATDAASLHDAAVTYARASDVFSTTLDLGLLTILQPPPLSTLSRTLAGGGRRRGLSH